MRSPLPLLLIGLACGLSDLTSQEVRAQDIQAIRDELRRSLRKIGYAQSLVGLVLLSDELEFSGAHYRVSDSSDTTTLTSFVVPFHTTVEAFGADAPELYFEGVVGYARADQDTKDVWDGALPGFETAVDTSFSTYSGLVGTGIQFAITEDLTVTPILNAGLAHLENDTSYRGPGAALTRSLLDGLAFNWDSLVLSTGVAGRTEWKHTLDECHELTVLGRYDLRWSETLREDDPAQEFRTRTQLATVRADLTGPTGLELLGEELQWRIHGGYRWFLEGDFFGLDGFATLGGNLELDTENLFPFGSQVSLGFAVFLGADFWGWSVGLSFSL